MHCPIIQIDAFTEYLFGGNPAAVVILDDWPADEVLQAIAAENNLAETAFVIPEQPVAQLRWFTPAVEMDLCGHATLAAADVLLRDGLVSGDRVRFSTRSGEVAVGRDGPRLSLDFPARPGEPVAVTDAVVAALGQRPRELFAARDLLCVFDDAATVAALAPAMERVAALDTFAVIATAPGDDVDFVSRFFAPGAGVPEDPVTGSAHCTLTPYWAQRLGQDRLTARQLSPRGGELVCEARGERVGIGGACVEYLRGTIALP